MYKSVYTIGNMPFLALFFLFFSSATLPEKNVSGHWINEKDLYDMELNDTLIFTKTKYRETLYHWGGALSGIELGKENHFAEYHNVMCSTESSPVRYSDEKWEIKDNRIFISGQNREIEWTVLKAGKKQLTVVVTKLSVHEQ